jgi:hypothetical protein
MCESEARNGRIFKKVKQIVRNNKDVINYGYIRDKDGNIVTDEERKRNIWK